MLVFQTRTGACAASLAEMRRVANGRCRQTFHPADRQFFEKEVFKSSTHGPRKGGNARD